MDLTNLQGRRDGSGTPLTRQLAHIGHAFRPANPAAPPPAPPPVTILRPCLPAPVTPRPAFRAR